MKQTFVIKVKAKAIAKSYILVQATSLEEALKLSKELTVNPNGFRDIYGNI